jgi:hypothetical protein
MLLICIYTSHDLQKMTYLFCAILVPAPIAISAAEPNEFSVTLDSEHVLRIRYVPHLVPKDAHHFARSRDVPSHARAESISENS